MDRRSGKVIVVAHCILNQNSRVLGGAHYSAVVNEVVDFLRRHEVGYLQMPCPELTFAGLKRSPKTKPEYDTPNYRRHCRRIAISTVRTLKEFVKGNVAVVALLGIKNSPSCNVSNSEDGTGILMEELLEEIESINIHPATRTIDASKIVTDVEWLEKLFSTI